MTDERAGAVFDALADPTRRTVLRTVAEHGPVTATQLATRLPITRQAVTKHLDALQGVGLVAREKVGRDVRFTFHAAPVDDAIAWLSINGTRWDQRLKQLEARVKRPAPG